MFEYVAAGLGVIALTGWNWRVRTRKRIVSLSWPSNLSSETVRAYTPIYLRANGFKAELTRIATADYIVEKDGRKFCILCCGTRSNVDAVRLKDYEWQARVNRLPVILVFHAEANFYKINASAVGMARVISSQELPNIAEYVDACQEQLQKYFDHMKTLTSDHEAGFIPEPSGSDPQELQVCESGSVVDEIHIMRVQDDGQTAKPTPSAFDSVDDVVVRFGEGLPAISDADLLSGLYDGTIVIDADFTRGLVPDDQVRCISLVDKTSGRVAHKIAFLFLALSVVKGHNGWLHYNLTKYLNELLSQGIVQARYPAILHGFMTNEAFASSPATRVLSERLLAKELIAISPRDAVRFALQATRAGDAAAFGFARTAAARMRLQPPPVHQTSLSAIGSLAGELDLNVGSLPQLVQARDAGSTAFVESRHKLLMPQVRGDTEYYMYRGAASSVDVPAIDVIKIKGGTLSIDISQLGLTQFYVFDEAGSCIVDLSHGMNPFIEDVEHLSGSVAMLDDAYSGNMNICHYLLDKISRIALYDRPGSAPERYLLAESYPYYKEVVSFLGLESKFIFQKRRRFSVKADELQISTNITHSFRHPAHLCSPWAINFLRHRFGGAATSPSGSRKIFISRADAKGRDIVNWDEAALVIRDRGYDTVTLSGRTFAEQVEIFSNASHVAGVHGAGLTNILFAPSDCRVLEVLPPFVASHAYWLLASAIGQQYVGLIADDQYSARPDYSSWHHNAAYDRRNILLPLDRLRTALV